MWKIIIILAVNVIFYARTITFNYVSDDLPIFANPPPIKNKWHRICMWVFGFLKWSPKRDHALTMFIHALNGVLIYLAFGASDVSFVAALLFCLNPVTAHGGVWISGRPYALSAILILTATACKYIAPFTVILSAGITQGFLSPLALIGTDSWWAIFFMPIGIWLWRKSLRNTIKGKVASEAVTGDKKIDIKKFIVAIKTTGFYLALAIIPFKMTFYHSFLQSGAGAGNEIMRKRAHSLCKFFWIGLAAMMAWVTYVTVYGWDSISHGMFWYFICIAPFSNFRRLQQEISQRYCYIATIGLMVALSSIIIQYPILITFFLTLYATRLVFHLWTWKDDYWLVEGGVMEDPKAWFGWHVRGHKRWQQGSHREALNMWVMAKMISPQEFKVLFNIAVVLKMLKKDAECEEYLKLAQQNIIAGQEKQSMGIINSFRGGQAQLLK